MQGWVSNAYKIAFLVLFTAWFSPNGEAQWEWLSNPPQSPPSYPASPSDQAETPPRSAVRAARLNRPGSDQCVGHPTRGSLQDTIQQQKPRKKLSTKKRKTGETRQKTEEAATGSVTSPTSAGTKKPKKPTPFTALGTKNSAKSIPRRKAVETTGKGTQSSSMNINAALQENDWVEISDKAAKNPAVSAFRNCIASYSAREVGKDIHRTWADLLMRATEGECRAQFDDMAQRLSQRVGEKRVEPVLRRLIETTLLPAVKAAVVSKHDARILSIPSH